MEKKNVNANKRGSKRKKKNIIATSLNLNKKLFYHPYIRALDINFLNRHFSLSIHTTIIMMESKEEKKAVSLKALLEVSFYYGQLPLINNIFSHFAFHTCNR